MEILKEAYRAIFEKDPNPLITELELAEIAIEGLGEKHSLELRIRCKEYILNNASLPPDTRRIAMTYMKLPVPVNV